MAVMTDPQRAAVWKAYMEALSSRRDALGSLTKQEARTAINATDQWISDNQASYNTALSAAFKTATSAAQQIELFKMVANARNSAGV